MGMSDGLYREMASMQSADSTKLEKLQHSRVSQQNGNSQRNNDSQDGPISSEMA